MKPFEKETTVGEKYRPAMEITDQAEASAYFDRCVEHSMLHGLSRAQAEAQERANLGYYAGYFDHETRLRVEKLFGCQHPVFGKASGGAPSAEEALELGKRRVLKGGPDA